MQTEPKITRPQLHQLTKRSLPFVVRLGPIRLAGAVATLREGADLERGMLTVQNDSINRPNYRRLHLFRDRGSYQRDYGGHPDLGDGAEVPDPLGRREAN
jgi:hypothetical protein